MWIKCVDTNDLVICTRGKVSTVPREAYCMYGSRVVAHGGQLFGTVEGRVSRVEDGFNGPDPDIAI